VDAVLVEILAAAQLMADLPALAVVVAVVADVDQRKITFIHLVLLSPQNP
jgi:hypothetical protein